MSLEISFEFSGQQAAEALLDKLHEISPDAGEAVRKMGVHINVRITQYPGNGALRVQWSPKATNP